MTHYGDNEVVRCLILLTNGDYYVIDGRAEYGKYYVYGDIATGGRVWVPKENVKAVEEYTMSQIELFRSRLKMLSDHVHGKNPVGSLDKLFTRGY